MDSEKLKVLIALETLIKITEKACDVINSWITESYELSTGTGGSYKRDCNYSLCVSEHQDGSGKRLDLSRYYGNTLLLSVIKKELDRQLEEFKRDFDKM